MTMVVIRGFALLRFGLASINPNDRISRPRAIDLIELAILRSDVVCTTQATGGNGTIDTEEAGRDESKGDAEQGAYVGC
ncbi:hypothetical protein Pcac1_g8197 [Phytophthora cactorum]|nr:hypothetical protein Pcac1_g8197 [Phytophthora cactorum]KAG2909698.1 hypothetical protein PC114_g10011 [Phytophthora cactorum]KAG3021807.1 hypothetical protein PC119_g9491 [Phytophthora cactorum]KAG3171871.1 hypothetical protein C6341_g10383 [Phytophthora cactorum]